MGRASSRLGAVNGDEERQREQERDEQEHESGGGGAVVAGAVNTVESIGRARIRQPGAIFSVPLTRR